ncbi:MAG: aminoacyl-histidine dipeptidase [Eubacteriaceae bacterium]|nr:aminoacyl-histidine dipeptidase [Eubacteriaceae bacterium]
MPEKVLEFFYELSQIPRGSGNEEAISAWLGGFAADRGLEVTRDEYNNVIIKKSGTPGKENLPTVILQGHMDMVCEKNKDTVFDFETEPLKLEIDGDFIFAQGTTLGADNGIGVAMILAVLYSSDLVHPPIEGIFTVDEERGLTGALNLDVKGLKGSYLINIDTENDKEILTSCAGGVRINHKIKIKTIKRPEDFQCCEISISGLKGGHSGMDITKGRGNANKLMARVLDAIRQEMKMHLISVSGGSKDNAIPREAQCRMIIDKKEKENLELILKEYHRYFTLEHGESDPVIKIQREYVFDPCTEIMDRQTTDKVIDLILVIPDGVLSMSQELIGMPVSSNNIGIVDTEDGNVTVSSAARSSVDSKKIEIIDTMKAISRQLETVFGMQGDYPGWSYSPQSPLREHAIMTYKDLFGEEPEVVAVHAGVECGILGEKIPGLDMISIGPNIYDVHSPREKLSITSTKKTWAFLKEILATIK